MTYSTSFRRMLLNLCSSHECNVSEALLNRGCNDEIDYVTMRGTMISYLPNGKEHIINEDTGRWARDNRQEGKIGRVTRKLLTDYDLRNITDAEIEKFSNLVFAYVSANGDGESDVNDTQIKLFVCNGSLIPLYYDHHCYNNNVSTGNLYDSCMKTREYEYFEIYETSPDNVWMAVAKDIDNLVIGRALIWVSNDGTKKYMDTIYASTEVRQIFINFAKENGIAYKSQQSCHHNQFDMLNGEKLSHYQVSIKLDPDSDSLDYYPYMDTLYYMQDNIVSNYEFSSGEYYELRSTGGDRNLVGGDDDEEGMVECIVTGDMVDENDAYYVDYRHNGRLYCGYAHSDEVVTDYRGNYVLYNHTVEVRNDYYLTDSDSIAYVEYANDYFHVDDVVWDIHGEPILRDDAVKLHTSTLHDGEYIMEGDAINVDGKWYRESEVAWDDDSQSYFVIDDTNNNQIKSEAND